jgi:hypothetical protein
MRSAIILTLLLTACYSKSDAVEQLRDKGRPTPITCVKASGGSESAYSFVCEDGAGFIWACDSDACIKTGKQ